MTFSSRITAFYRVRADASAIEDKARAVANEQSVEMPLEAISDARVLGTIVGRVESIDDCGQGEFLVRISLSAETAGGEAGQLLNMLFGNTSIHDTVSLEDIELPASLLEAFGGPRVGMRALQARAGAQHRALSCAALKPQGLSVAALADIAGRLARGGVDFIKDDHGLANQLYSPFAERVAACAAAVRSASAETGLPTRYAPNVSGNLDNLRQQIALACDEGLDTVLIEPMICGLSAFHTVTREFSSVAFLAHPAMAGAARIAPPLLLGKLFRLFGATATIFPHYGGRFGYSLETCNEIARASRDEWAGLDACLPAPAGGVTMDRLTEILEFYGPDIMVLMGGGLLAAGERLTEETETFARRLRGLRL
ncbi:MAG: RuBisCO large subunit C-terminal-like domain-containing protein [Hyphomicrobiales bacterium]|nr:RuBisCO large subunit C-terminal-like domain-containing protein [Hyphomicrobiales bacterium]